MQLIPMLSAPATRLLFTSRIAPLDPESESAMRVKVSLPEDLESNYFMAVFRVKTSKRQFVGPQLVVFIKIKEEPRDPALKSSFDDSVDDSEIAGEQKYSEEQYEGMGSILLDEGYGSFERCVMAVRTVDGDMELARKILSKIVFTEAQFRP